MHTIKTIRPTRMVLRLITFSRNQKSSNFLLKKRPLLSGRFCLWANESVAKPCTAACAALKGWLADLLDRCQGFLFLEKVRFRRLGDGGDARVGDAPLHRNRKKLLHQVRRSADHLHAELRGSFVVEHGG
jgi:hypothetical protein